MRKILITFTLLLFFSVAASAQQLTIDSIFPVRGLCIEAPFSNTLDSFVNFVDKELAPRKLNTLIS